MKEVIALVFVLLSIESSATTLSSDSTKHFHWKQISVGVTWFEYGVALPTKEKSISNLPFGMDEYLKYNKPGSAFSLLGIDLWYKNKVGIGVIYDYSDFGHDGDSFNKYITRRFPNYYIKNGWNNGFSVDGLGYRLNYRFKFKQIEITPRFQIGINNYVFANDSRSFKEKGSNHIIEYSIEKRSLMNKVFDYHFLIDGTRRIGKKNTLPTLALRQSL